MGPDEDRSLLEGHWRGKSQRWLVLTSLSGSEGGLNADGYQKGSLFSLKMNKLAASFVTVSMAVEEEKRKTLE